jgi:signal transduction histidine kinase
VAARLGAHQVKDSKPLSIFGDPIALSRPVLLLQIPIALILSFGTRLPQINQHPVLIVLFAGSFMLGAGICFAVGNFVLEKYSVLRDHRPAITLSIWLLTGFQSVLIAQLVQSTTGGNLLALRVRIIFIPAMWIASLFCASLMFRARQKYVIAFRQLRETYNHLAHIEETEHKALQAERAQLVSVVTDRIKPELKEISAKIRTTDFQKQEQNFSEILEQVDNYALKTVRKMIVELNTASLIDPPGNSGYGPAATPKLYLRNLPLDPIKSFRITIGVGLTLLLPIVGIKIAFLWLIQETIIFSPVFAMRYLLSRQARLAKVPQVIWVLTACFVAVTMRAVVIGALPAVRQATNEAFLPIASGFLLALSIVLGSLDKYFVDEYMMAANDQEVANKKLLRDLERVQFNRQLARRDLSRLLHGPIQGRLAAVRIKLNLLSNASRANRLAPSQDDISDLVRKVEEITDEIETFAVRQRHQESVDVAAEITILISNWQGLLEISFYPAQAAIELLGSDPYLSRKIVDACAESITNASRHGNAKQIKIHLDLVTEDSIIRLKVIDNGKKANIGSSPGIGLQDISSDGGMWSYEMTESGTTFVVDFPITNLLFSSN